MIRDTFLKMKLGFSLISLMTQLHLILMDVSTNMNFLDLLYSLEKLGMNQFIMQNLSLMI